MRKELCDADTLRETNLSMLVSCFEKLTFQQKKTLPNSLIPILIEKTNNEFGSLIMEEQLYLLANLILICGTPDYASLKPFVSQVLNTVESNNYECDLHSYVAFCHFLFRFEKATQQRKIEDYESIFRITHILVEATSKLSTSLAFYANQISQKTLLNLFDAIDLVEDNKITQNIEHLLESLVDVIRTHSLEPIWEELLRDRFQACIESKKFARLESKAKELADRVAHPENKRYDAQRHPEIISLTEPL